MRYLTEGAGLPTAVIQRFGLGYAPIRLIYSGIT